jgi:hypothetical protein
MKTTFWRKGGGRGIVTASHVVLVLELQKVMGLINSSSNNNNNSNSNKEICQLLSKSCRSKNLFPSLVHPRRRMQKDAERRFI